MIKTSIIIINYNNYNDTIECIESLNKVIDNNVRIVVIDNGSKNESVDNLRKYLTSKVHFIELKKNLGFAGANNIGIKYAINEGTDYILLLNNDTIVENNFLDNMLQSFSSDNVGVVGCKINYYSNKNVIWFGGGKIDWFSFKGVNLEMKKKDNNINESPKEVDFLTGCCMLIKRQVIERVGLIPEEYFMYYEDVDFCVKVAENGYKLIYNPYSVILHKVSVSSGGEESEFLIEYITRNKRVFMKKYKHHVRKIQYLASIVGYYSINIIKILRFVCYKNNGKAKAVINGIIKSHGESFSYDEE